MKHNTNVPAFLTKLWTLVENVDTNELICWSKEGNSFLVFDEQRFAKEILPKFFKHNNMASFIRQLNMYGFRKVMHIDTSLVKQERDGPVEFQHPYFKHGQDDLLENIKRKVPNARPEDSRLRQEDLTQILASVQSVHSKQENIDAKLTTLKRENDALWREISDLRQKHAHQQQLIKKLIHFIVTLVQNNRILNLKRKRPSLMNSNGKKAKCIHQIFDDTSSSEDVIICDMTDGDVSVTTEITEESPRTLEQSTDVVSSATEDSRAASSALQLNKPPSLTLEDPMKMMDSILMENGAISQNLNLLGKLELMDYLDSIDCSLEDFQALLHGKQFGADLDAAEVKRCHIYSCVHFYKQLVQYTSCPLLSLLEGCSPAELDLGASGSSSSSSLEMLSSNSAIDADLPSELLDSRLESKQLPCSSLVRLEPLTEAEASEETLFQLCELSPGPEADASSLS
uniref:HSF-type DNA-binding domain-containing protein n=1 Tax=Gouania willdenowi TaxID=441366 RepID=A0A8C5EMI1_GOUWI